MRWWDRSRSETQHYGLGKLTNRHKKFKHFYHIKITLKRQKALDRQIPHDCPLNSHYSSASDSRTDSPDAGLAAETGFPSGSFAIHATRSLIKNVANYGKDHKDKSWQVWALGQTVLLLHHRSFARGTGWAGCSPQGAFAFPFPWEEEKGLQWCGTRHVVLPGACGAVPWEAARAGGHWGDQDPRGDPSTPQSRRRCGEQEPEVRGPPRKKKYFPL